MARKTCPDCGRRTRISTQTPEEATNGPVLAKARNLALAVAFCGAAASAPLVAVDLATYSDGSTKLVDLVATEIEFSEGASEIRVPDYALQTIRHLQGDEYAARLKDGSEIRGVLLTPLELRDGLVVRRDPSGTVSRIDFDVFLDPAVVGPIEQCPLRLVRPIPMILSKETEWWDNSLRLIECKDVHLNVARYERRKRHRIKGVDQHGKKVTQQSMFLELSAWFPKGQDMYVEISVSIRQGDRVLSRHRSVQESDEGENNVFEPIKLTYIREELDPAGPPPQILFQLQQLPERGVPSKDKGPHAWFSVWLTHQVTSRIK